MVKKSFQLLNMKMGLFQVQYKYKMVTIIFTRTVHLLRFTMEKGEKWEVRKAKLKPEGFTLGKGFICAADYKVKE